MSDSDVRGPRLDVYKHGGQRGEPFVQWAKVFLDGAEGRGDQDASYADTFLRRDTRNGLGGAAAGRMKQRDRESYAYLLLHLDCPTLKAMIRAEADRKGGKAWDVVLRECNHKDSALRGTKRRMTVLNLTIRGAVGLSVSSLTDYNRLMTDKNEELPMDKKFTQDEIVEKILTDIIQPPILAHEAAAILEVPVALRPARFYTQEVEADDDNNIVAVPGGWIRSAVIAHLDELWREAWARGEISPAVASDRTVRTGPSPRADGMAAVEMDEYGEYVHHVTDHLEVTDQAKSAVMLLHEAHDRDSGTDGCFHVMECLRGMSDQDVALAADALEKEKVCYNCRGIGHLARDCPSPRRERALPEVIALLQSLGAERTNRNRQRSFARGRGGRGGRGRGGRFAGGRTGRGPSPSSEASTAGPHEAFEAEILPDGRIVQVVGHAHAAIEDEASASQEIPTTIDSGAADHSTPTDTTQEAARSAHDAAGGQEADDDDIFGFDAMDFWDAPGPRPWWKTTGARIAAGVGIALVMACTMATAVRRNVPDPKRLATMLVLTGAQSASALAPREPQLFADLGGGLAPGGARFKASTVTSAAICGIAGGALMHSYALDNWDPKAVATDLALAGLESPSGLITPARLKDSWKWQLKPKAPPPKSPSSPPPSLLIDCGATSTMVNAISKLTRVTCTSPNRSVRVANNAVLPATHMGEIDMPVVAKYRRKGHKMIKRATTMTISKVLVVPGLATDLFSCHGAFENDGIETHLNSEQFLRLPDQGEVSFAPDTGKRYEVKAAHELAAAAAVSPSEADLIHASLGHFSPDRIDMARLRSRGMEIPSKSDICALHAAKNCVACGLGGAIAPSISSKKAPEVDHEARRFGDCVHCDICGPFPTATITGFRYCIGFADRGTRRIAVYFLKTQDGDEVRDAIETYVADYGHLMKDGHVKKFVSDNGGGFMAATVDQLLNELHTKKAMSVPYTPQRNGLIERFWYTLVRHTRIMLAESGHSAALWPFAMQHVTDIHNSLPTRSLSPPMSPYEASTGKKPNLGHFKGKVWGCDTICHVRKEDRDHKLSSTGVKASFMGLDRRRQGEFHFVAGENKFISVVKAHKYYPRSFSALTLTPAPTIAIHEKGEDTRQFIIGDHKIGYATPIGSIDPNLPIATAVPLRAMEPRAVTNHAAATYDYPANYTVFSSGHASDIFAVDLAAAVHDVPSPPSNHAEIGGRRDEKEWIKAEWEDFNAKLEKGAIEVIDRSEMPRGTKAIKTRHAYANKLNADGTLKERRARFVGCGYSQIPGEDFNETSCGTLRAAGVRSLVCTACIDDLDICLGDIEKAFTTCKMDVKMYGEIPTYMNMPGKVIAIHNSLEGLKQSGWIFQTELFKHLASIGGKQSLEDPNLWEFNVNGTRVIAGVWVDDILFMTPRGQRKAAEAVWAKVGKAFKVKPLETEPERFVGLEIKRDRKHGTLTIAQTRYIDQMFDRFLKGRAKLWATPVADDEPSLQAFMDLSPTTDPHEAADVLNKGYMSVVGSLLYASAMTRPDIAFYVAFLAKMMHAPSEKALNAAYDLLSYLKKTRTVGITYSRNEVMTMYADSSFSRSTKPMAGHVVFYGGAALSWASKALKIVPLSSAEAETAVVSLGCKDMMYTKQLMGFLRPGMTADSVDVYTDNTACVDIIKAQGVTARTKHFERWVSYARDLYQRYVIRINHISTDKMPADIFTKALGSEKFFLFRSMLLNCGLKV
jgi:hypothetical protein